MTDEREFTLNPQGPVGCLLVYRALRIGCMYIDDVLEHSVGIRNAKGVNKDDGNKGSLFSSKSSLTYGEVREIALLLQCRV